MPFLPSSQWNTVRTILNADRIPFTQFSLIQSVFYYHCPKRNYWDNDYAFLTYSQSAWVEHCSYNALDTCRFINECWKRSLELISLYNNVVVITIVSKIFLSYIWRVILISIVFFTCSTHISAVWADNYQKDKASSVSKVCEILSAEIHLMTYYQVPLWNYKKVRMTPKPIYLDVHFQIPCSPGSP